LKINTNVKENLRRNDLDFKSVPIETYKNIPVFSNLGWQFVNNECNFSAETAVCKSLFLDFHIFIRIRIMPKY
jgi:hypothetical protein